MPTVAPPRVVGVKDIAAIFGVTEAHVRANARPGRRFEVGYLGKIAGAHCWNLNVVLGPLFTPQQLDDFLLGVDGVLPSPTCCVKDCDGEAMTATLCAKHLRRFVQAWDQSSRSRARGLQLVGMARWVVAHNQNVVLPAEWDPFGNVCLVEGCGNPIATPEDASWAGPMCRPCTRRFHDRLPKKGRPSHWRKTRAERFDPDGDDT